MRELLGTKRAARVERLQLAKRLWRGVAADGTEFGFELEAPLKHGDAFFQSATARYVIEQQPEPVVEIDLAIADLEKHCSFLKVLGSYPKSDPVE